MLLCDVITYWDKLSELQKYNILLRPKMLHENNLESMIKSILLNVKKFGDDALFQYTEKFDNISLNCFHVSRTRINESEYFLSSEIKNAILVAKKNIEFFHQQQKLPMIDIHTQVGINCRQISLPIESVGLYVPGGTAPLLSTALMLSIPACIAKCKNIVLCSSPPISNEILYVSKICGIHQVFEIGGAQAIAALGFGTKMIPKVNKIFGPGNMYVTEAKKQLLQLIPNISIDMIAGPSELLIISDESSNPVFIASDVLSQLEHGTDSQVIVVSNTKKILELIIFHINQQLPNLLRKKIIHKSLLNSRFIFVKDFSDCVIISNLYAPEHLIIQSKYPDRVLKYITNAGSIFLGNWSPESVGDYASGTNHVLPTHGSSVSFSGLSVLDFQKRITVQELTPFGLRNIADTVKLLSLSEKMDAHSNAVTVRINDIRSKYGK
ncbi:histidinol dehydrogenase [Buchnera aphidicola]|uniref:histidinol dehydrogenase n=1 Tax=Buchnera aphidicola TaxID=9 RepID=UPI003463BE42